MNFLHSSNIKLHMVEQRLELALHLNIMNKLLSASEHFIRKNSQFVTL